jgi:alpha-tubulin suppressor-like RCC1 family protein
MRSLNDEFIVSAGAGYSHSMFISKKGEIWMYGDNSSGQLGVSGNYGFFNVPFKLERLINKRVIDCDGGYYHSIILIDDGKIYTCGSSQYGKLGIGKDRNTKEKANVVQTLVDNGDIVRSISAGGYHSAISTVTGKAYIMGHGSFGQCGQGAKLEVRCLIIF